MTNRGFSWKLESDKSDVIQESYQITVADKGNVVWDSGKIKSDESILREYAGDKLLPMTKYTVNVNVIDNHGETASAGTFFETGLMGNFRASWITHDLPDDETACPVFKKDFICKKEIASARIYSTALGLYDMELNGKRVGDEYFSPGWTSYNKRLQYQTYDINEYLKDSNEIIVTVANGWYKGNLAFEGRKNIYGNKAAILMEVHLLVFLSIPRHLSLRLF